MYVLDVVGQITFVQGSNLDEPTSTQRLVVRFKLDTYDLNASKNIISLRKIIVDITFSNFHFAGQL